MLAPTEPVPIAAQRASELRLIGDDGRAGCVVRFTRGSDDAARQVILRVTEPYARYELWRGMEKLGGGARIVIGN